MLDRVADNNSPLGQLKALAGQSFDGARALPKDFYTSTEFLELENEHLFRREWVCVGRAEALAKRGDYLTFELADQPIVVLRNNKDQIHAYSNVCLHRMSTLLHGRGNTRMIVCPYHAWSYGLDGKLKNAPYMDQSPGFDPKRCKLPEVRSEIWEGWIYVTLNPDIAPVSKRLASLSEKVTGRYRMGDYIETFREEHVWNTNWKILAENFMESYHLFALHRATVGPFSKVEEMECPEGEPTFNYHWITKESALAIGNAHPDNDYLEGDWRRTTALITIYPSHMITLTPGYFWYLVLRPRGVDQVDILYGGGLARHFVDDDKGATYMEDMKKLLDEVNEEDRIGVERVFRGLNAPLAEPGHLSYLERPNYEFGQYLARQITRDT